MKLYQSLLGTSNQDYNLLHHAITQYATFYVQEFCCTEEIPHGSGTTVDHPQCDKYPASHNLFHF